MCHANAQSWVTAHRGDVVVHGWLHIAGMPGLDAVFESHSAIRTALGNLADVTKPEGSIHAFLEHIGPAEEFLQKTSLGDPWVRVMELIAPSVLAELIATWPSEQLD